MKTITTILALVLSQPVYADQPKTVDLTQTGDGCMWTAKQGVCAIQLHAPDGKSRVCTINAQGFLVNGKSVEARKTSRLAPSEYSGITVTAPSEAQLTHVRVTYKCV